MFIWHNNNNSYLPPFWQTQQAEACANEGVQSNGVQSDGKADNQENDIEIIFEDRMDDFSRGQEPVPTLMGFLSALLGGVLGALCGFGIGMQGGLHHAGFEHCGKRYDIYSNHGFGNEFGCDDISLNKANLFSRKFGLNENSLKQFEEKGILTFDEETQEYKFNKEVADNLLGGDFKSFSDFMKSFNSKGTLYQYASNKLDKEDMEKFLIGPVQGKCILDKQAIQEQFPEEEYGEIKTIDDLKAAINKSKAEERKEEAQSYIESFIESFADELKEKFNSAIDGLVDLFVDGDIDMNILKSQINLIGESLKEEQEHEQNLKSIQAESFVKSYFNSLNYGEHGRPARIRVSGMDKYIQAYANGEISFREFAKKVINAADSAMQ